VDEGAEEGSSSISSLDPKGCLEVGRAVATGDEGKQVCPIGVATDGDPEVGAAVYPTWCVEAGVCTDRFLSTST
jgi:hypothetical protein